MQKRIVKLMSEMSRKFDWKEWLKRRILAGPGRSTARRRRYGVLFLPILLLLLDYYAYPYGMPIGGRSFDQGRNGLWLSYTWYFGHEKASDLTLLPLRLRENTIHYAYFHVRFINRRGSLQYHYPASARRIVRRLHHETPGLKVIAWIYAGNSRGMGSVDLSDPAVRKAMVKETRWLAVECGFDGIQWDYEICSNGDPDFVHLLDETRAALPPDKLISVASPLWLPALFRRWGWSDEYYRQIASRCDQVAVMAYDSGIFLPRLYVWLVRQQIVHVTRDVSQSNRHCRVVIGIPTYPAGGFSHHSRAENLVMALRGVREGLADPRGIPSACDGVALFADYTTRPDDWRDYRRLWGRFAPGIR